MNAHIVTELLAKQNVVSVGKGIKTVGGVSTGKPCIVVGVRRKLPIAELRARDIIPKTIGNPPEDTDVVIVGEIRFL